MERGFLGERGQTSVEFLFLFLIMLVYLQSVIQPASEESSASVIAVNRFGQAKLAAQKLANSINEVSALSGDSSKTLWLFIDEDTKFWCESGGIGGAPGGGNKAIWFQVHSDVNMDKLPQCSNFDCDGRVGVLDDIALDCQNFPHAPQQAPPKSRVRVWKDGAITYVQRLD